MNPCNSRRLAAAMGLALLLPGVALAQDSGEAAELAARIVQLEAASAELKAEIAALRALLVQPPAPAVPVPPALAPASSPAPVVASGNTAFSFGGFVKLDAMSTQYSDGPLANGHGGRLFYLPSATPVAAGGAEQRHTYTDVSAQLSRLFFNAEKATDSGDRFKGYVEFDFYGGGSNSFNGNEVATNTYALTLRHAYASWNHWLVGQTWSNAIDVSVLPEAVDFVGVGDGTLFVRQGQIRYTRGKWSFSLENPENYVYPGFSAAGTSESTLPDFTGRYATRGDWGSFSIAAIARQITAGSEDKFGGGLSIAGRVNLGRNDSIGYMLTGGSGLGRYYGAALGFDAVLAGGELELVDVYGGFVNWRHVIGPKLRTNLMLSGAKVDYDDALLALTRNTGSVAANIFYSPQPKWDVGVELRYATRELVNGDEGNLKRLHTTVKYSF